jgi:Chalcone isomerase-like
MPATSMWSSTRSAVERALCGLLLGLSLGAAQAQAITGTDATSLPARIPSSSHPQLEGSRLQGEAGLRFFGLRIYQARLWTLPDFRPQRSEDQPLVLELEYQRDFKGREIAERSLQEMRRIEGFSEEQAARWLSQMQRLFPDVRPGDRISGRHLPGRGAEFWVNGRQAGRVEDPDFARLFFGIWLAPTTSEPALRLALLGLTGASRP